MLAIPPALDSCERLFSSAKLLITNLRARLKMDIIEANECLRSWFGPPDKSAFDVESIVEVSSSEELPGEEPENDMIGDSEAGPINEVLESYDSDVEDVILDDEQQEKEVEDVEASTKA